MRGRIIGDFLAVCRLLDGLALADVQQRVDVGLELNVDAILVHRNALDQEFQILFVQPILGENGIEDFQCRTGQPIHADDVVAVIREHLQLILQALQLGRVLGFQLVVGFVDDVLLLGLAHQLCQLLLGQQLSMLLDLLDLPLQQRKRRFALLDGLLLMSHGLVQRFQHEGAVLLDAKNVLLEQRVQQIHARVVRRAALAPAPVIAAAGVRRSQICAAHGEHGAAAVAAVQESGIGIVVLPHAAIGAGGALFHLLLRIGERAIIHDGLVVLFKDDMVIVLLLEVLSVDAEPTVFALAQRADVKVVLQNA